MWIAVLVKEDFVQYMVIMHYKLYVYYHTKEFEYKSVFMTLVTAA